MTARARLGTSARRRAEVLRRNVGWGTELGDSPGVVRWCVISEESPERKHDWKVCSTKADVHFEAMGEVSASSSTFNQV